MSYRCEFCCKPSRPNEKMRLVPVETRQRVYKNGEGKDVLGSEVVIESKQCPRCERRAAGLPEIAPADAVAIQLDDQQVADLKRVGAIPV